MTDLFTCMASVNTWSNSFFGQGEAGLRLTMHTSRQSPPKELPSKTLKYQRMSERQHIPNNLHSRMHNRKCAGTQTPFSSLTGDTSYPLPSESYQQPPHEGYHILDLDGRHRVETMSVPTHTMMRQSQGHVDDLSSTPLNLTTTSSSPSSASSSGDLGQPVQPHVHFQQRPSVITCHPHGPRERVLPKRTAELETQCRLQSELGNPCDPAIEEHFRRSLGKNYTNYLGSTNHPGESSSPPAACHEHPAASQNTAHNPEVSVTGCVDDHFAKSLGDTWTQIKAQSDPVIMDIFSGSVDDHFAKALGDTWLKIKAERESGSSPPSSAPSSPISPSPQHQTHSMVPT